MSRLESEEEGRDPLFNPKRDDEEMLRNLDIAKEEHRLVVKPVNHPSISTIDTNLRRSVTATLRRPRNLFHSVQTRFSWSRTTFVSSENSVNESLHVQPDTFARMREVKVNKPHLPSPVPKPAVYTNPPAAYSSTPFQNPLSPSSAHYHENHEKEESEPVSSESVVIRVITLCLSAFIILAVIGTLTFRGGDEEEEEAIEDSDVPTAFPTLFPSSFPTPALFADLDALPRAEAEAICARQDVVNFPGLTSACLSDTEALICDNGVLVDESVAFFGLIRDFIFECTDNEDGERDCSCPIGVLVEDISTCHCRKHQTVVTKQVS